MAQPRGEPASVGSSQHALDALIHAAGEGPRVELESPIRFPRDLKAEFRTDREAVARLKAKLEKDVPKTIAAFL